MTPSTDRGSGGEARALGTFDRLLAGIETFFNLVAAACILALMFLGMAQVLGRQLFNLPMAGYIDFIELSMATFAFLGIAYCQRVNGHVRMELFLKLTSGRGLWVLEFAGTVVALAVIGVLAWYGFDHFLRAYELGDSTIDAEYPVWPSKLIVPIAFGLLWLRLLLQLVAYARLIAHPDAEPIAVPKLLSVAELAAQEIAETEGGSSRARRS